MSTTTTCHQINFLTSDAYNIRETSPGMIDMVLLSNGGSVVTGTTIVNTCIRRAYAIKMSEI